MRTKEELKAYAKAWRVKNPDKVAAYGRNYATSPSGRVRLQAYRREYRAKNVETSNTYHREWYRKNRDRLLVKNRVWRDANRDRLRMLERRRYHKNPDKFRAKGLGYYYKNHDSIVIGKRAKYKNDPIYDKYRALQFRSQAKGMPFLITRDEFSHWYGRQEQRCAYCGLADLVHDDKPFGGGRKSGFFSIDRRDSNLPYVVENMVLACVRCNRLKNNFFTYDQWKEIAEKYIRPHWMGMLGVGNVA